MTPFVRTAHFLDPIAHARILDWTLVNEASFSPAMVSAPSVANANSVDTRLRRAVRYALPQDIGRTLRTALKPRLPELLARLGMHPFESRPEMEATAHGNGAMFRRHVDTGVGTTIAKSRRLSLVYYYFCEPKAFSGGYLRMHSLLSKDYVDIKPEQNLLLAFPSFIPHEVTPIRCASEKFESSRFAINIWLHDKNRVAIPEESARATHAKSS